MANSAEPARDGEIPPVVWMLPDRPGRGPKPAHSREQITAAAIRIADAEGLDAVTMRRVAAEVGSGTMTLYRYVPTKDHLLDLMIDATEGEVVFPDVAAGDWRAGLRAVGRGAVIAELAEQEAQRRTGLNTQQWQARIAAYVAKLIESGKYPAFNRIITDAKLPHSGADEGFTRGLELVLDGLAASVPAPHRPTARPPD